MSQETVHKHRELTDGFAKTIHRIFHQEIDEVEKIMAHHPYSTRAGIDRASFDAGSAAAIRILRFRLDATDEEFAAAGMRDSPVIAELLASDKPLSRK